jgi:adenosylhomocysteine nucleosidase
LRSQNEWDQETPIAKYREIMGVPLPKVLEVLLPNHSLEIRGRTDSYFKCPGSFQIFERKSLFHLHSQQRLDGLFIGDCEAD